MWHKLFALSLLLVACGAFNIDNYLPDDYLGSDYVEREPSQYQQFQPVDRQYYYDGEADSELPEFVDRNLISQMYQAAPVAKNPVNHEQRRSYCHPPNPCPKGYSPEKNGCDANVRDSADWNKLNQEQDMKSGKCACDVEHMFSCPPGVPSVSVAIAKQESQKERQQAQMAAEAGAQPADEFQEAKKSPRFSKLY